MDVHLGDGASQSGQIEVAVAKAVAVAVAAGIECVVAAGSRAVSDAAGGTLFLGSVARAASLPDEVGTVVPKVLAAVVPHAVFEPGGRDRAPYFH